MREAPALSPFPARGWLRLPRSPSLHPQGGAGSGNLLHISRTGEGGRALLKGTLNPGGREGGGPGFRAPIKSSKGASRHSPDWGKASGGGRVRGPGQPKSSWRIPALISRLAPGDEGAKRAP